MDPALLFQAFFVIGILSALYKYNIYYKICEHTFIALSVVVTATIASRTIINNAIVPLSNGDIFMIIPIAIGLLYLTRITVKYGYLARISYAVMIGAVLGSSVMVIVKSDIIGQITPVMSTSWISAGSDVASIIGNFYGWIGLIAGLTYFLFSTTWLTGTTNRVYNGLSRLGRYVMLAMIGAQFANVTMGRQSVFIERIYFLLKAFGLAS